MARAVSLSSRKIRFFAGTILGASLELVLPGAAYAASETPAVNADSRSGTVAQTPAHKKTTHGHSRMTRGQTVRTVTKSTSVTPVAASTQATGPAPKPRPAAASSTTTERTAALAETGQGGTENILVTGSRLTTNSISEVQPVTTMDAEQIRKRGYTNVGLALMQENPSFGVPDNSPIGSQGSNGAGQTYVNMYNLGSQRTLTLVNGHRFVSSATSSIFGSVSGSPVDFSMIPSALVKKVETVSVGGAPVYGSDAIAGTVNIKMDDRYQGIKLDGQSGWSQRLQDINYRLSLAAGHHFDHDKGSIVFGAEYNQQFGMKDSDTPWTGANSYYFSRATSGPYSYVLSQGSREPTYTATGIPTIKDGYANKYGVNYDGIRSPTGTSMIFSNDGKSLIPETYNHATNSSTNVAGGNGFATANYDNLIVDQQRLTLTSLAHYDITDHLHASWEGWYGHTLSTNTAHTPYYSAYAHGKAGAKNGSLIMSTDNPYLTSEERTTIINALAQAKQSTDTFYLNRANTDLYSGAYTTDEQLFRTVAGLNGDFDFLHRNFQWEVSGTYGRSLASTTQNQIVTQNLFNAVNAVRGSNGAITCAPGYTNATIATKSETCAPLDVFGVNQASQQAVNYVTAVSRTNQVNSQFDIVADVKGKIVQLPAGALSFVLGYEHRREGFQFNPGTFKAGQIQADGTCTPYGNSVCETAVSGAYHTHEAFGELDAPLISPQMHVAGVYNLALHSAGRYVYNSMTGGFWTWTAGAAYSPTRDITFRGNYTRSLRAPSVTELFAPQASVYDDGADPCDYGSINGGSHPAIRAANCAKAGVPKGFVSRISSSSVLGTSGGNPHLQNEAANSFTGGVLIRPRPVSGLMIQADYVDILIKHEIADLGISDVMDACYDSASYPSNSWCNQFTRDPNTHEITNFTEGYYNIASEHFRGLQASLRYDMPLTKVGFSPDAGEVGVSLNYLHQFYHAYQVGSGSLQNELGGSGSPKDNFTANFNYTRGPLYFQWQMMYYGKSRVSPNVPVSEYEYPYYNQYFLFNMTTGYTFLKHYNANFVMNNVFDARPQFPYTGSTSRYWEGIIGRSFKLDISAEF